MNVAHWMSLAVRLALGMQLIVGGWAKATAFDWWRDIVVQMDIFPISMTGVLAGILPGIEIILGLTFVLGIFRRASAICGILLFSLFTWIMFLLIQKNAPVMCGCFGPGSEYPVDWYRVVMDLALLVASISLVFLPDHRWRLRL